MCTCRFWLFEPALPGHATVSPAPPRFQPSISARAAGRAPAPAAFPLSGGAGPAAGLGAGHAPALGPPPPLPAALAADPNFLADMWSD
jgi:hypothetical protein